MKKIVLPAVSLLCALSLCGCLGRSKPDPPDLTGQWKQINSSSGTDYQGVYISDYAIECYWVLPSSGGAALYWAGTFSEPKEGNADGIYAWTSDADTSRTTNSLLTDKSASKKFKYEKGRITYEVDYEGVVMTVKAAPGSWGYGTKEYFGTTDMFDMVSGVFRDYLEEHPIPTEPPAEEQQETRELVPTPPEAPG